MLDKFGQVIFACGGEYFISAFGAFSCNQGYIGYSNILVYFLEGVSLPRNQVLFRPDNVFYGCLGRKTTFLNITILSRHCY